MISTDNRPANQIQKVENKAFARFEGMVLLSAMSYLYSKKPNTLFLNLISAELKSSKRGFAQDWKKFTTGQKYFAAKLTNQKIAKFLTK